MAGRRLLFLDDVRSPETVLGDIVVAVNDVTVCRTADEAREAVEGSPPFHAWHLDHDLGMEIKDHRGVVVSAVEKNAPSGMDFLKWASQHPDKWPVGRILVHSANPEGRKNMLAFIRSFERVTFGV